MKRCLVVLVAFVVLAGCAGDGDAVTETPVPLPHESVAPAATAVPLAQTPEPEQADQRSITVGGMGVEYAVPIRCVIDLGVSSRRSSVAKASQAAAAAGDAMAESLAANGIDAAEIQTTEFSIYPYYDHYPRIEGYEVHLGYRVAMPNVDAVGAVMAAAIAAGGDDARASGIRFETDTSALLEAARADAWADLEARAQSLASMAGEPLGEVLDVHEKVLVTSSQGMMQGGEGDSASFDIPVSPGVAGVTVLLTATFAIG